MSLTRLVRARLVQFCTYLFSRFWGVALLLVLWQLWVLTTTPNSLIVVPPLAVFRDIVAEPSVYIRSALWTLGIALAGLLSGILVGMLLAIAAWTSNLLSGMLGPAAILISSTPVVCIIPLLARIFGYRAPTEFVTVSIMMFFPSFVLASTGLRNLPPMSSGLLDTWNTSRIRRLRLLALPAAIPSLATAIRAGAAASVLVAVVAEYLMQTGGLGALFAITMQQFDIPRAFGASIFAMLLSAVLYSIAASAEHRIRALYN
jgi:ABC-type nitrate/sulfonate/bicarbonate transport system permease component